MIAVFQRVSQAWVKVDGAEIARIGRGALILLGVAKEDGSKDAVVLADKIAPLRVFQDDAGKMNLSLQDIKGEALVVSQFTLVAELKRGRRPGFEPAAPPEKAEPLVADFVKMLKVQGVSVKEGRFGAHMEVGLVNDGPVTFVLDSKEFG